MPFDPALPVRRSRSRPRAVLAGEESTNTITFAVLRRPNIPDIRPHHSVVPKRLELRIASAKPRNAGGASTRSVPGAASAADRAERIAHLTLRVEALVKKLADEKSRAGTPHLFARPPDVKEDKRFRRAPEALLAAIALIGLWFLPIGFLSDLSPDMTLAAVAAIPCALVIFVIGGAALWRAFRER